MNIANKLTVLRLVCIPFFIWSMYQFENYTVATVIFIFASVTDCLDGYLARRLNLITTFGKFADPLADKILVLSALILMVEKLQVPAYLIVIIICREFAVTGLRILLVEQGEVLAADWLGKFKTATQMIAIMFILMQDFGLKLSIGYIFLWISVILTVYSGIDYFYRSKNIFKNL